MRLTACGRGRGPRNEFRKVTHSALQHRVEAGLVQPVLFRGEMRPVRKKHRNSDLLRLFAWLDAVARRAERDDDVAVAAAPGGVSQNGGLCVTRGPAGHRVEARPRTATGNGTGPGSSAREIDRARDMRSLRRNSSLWPLRTGV